MAFHFFFRNFTPETQKHQDYGTIEEICPVVGTYFIYVRRAKYEKPSGNEQNAQILQAFPSHHEAAEKVGKSTFCSTNL